MDDVLVSLALWGVLSVALALPLRPVQRWPWAGGPEAVRLRLAQAYLGKLQGLATGNADVLLPLDLTQLGDLLAGVGLRLDDEGTAAAAPASVASVSRGRP